MVRRAISCYVQERRRTINKIECHVDDDNDDDDDDNVHLLVFIEVRRKKESHARPQCQACTMVPLRWF
jgi:hypothetical protein